ncbi:hypothetical protein KQI63_04590 [bacterium]|nr:hypothetical protein [bacterium]
MQGLVNLLLIAGLAMSVLLTFLVIKVVSGGLKRRASGLAEGLPLWAGVPAGWVDQQGEVALSDDPEPWPEGNWAQLLAEHRPKGHPDRPHVRSLEEGERHLLFLPGRNRGVNGWWVLLVDGENKPV